MDNDQLLEAIKEHMDGLEDRLTAKMNQKIEAAETRILKAFFGWAESFESKISSLAVNIPTLLQRQETLERRQLELERRLIALEHPGTEERPNV